MARSPLNAHTKQAAAGLWVVVALALVLAACDGSAESKQRAARAPDPAPSVRRTFYVAPGGSDADPGSRRRPFRTLRHALRRLRYDQLLYVRGGTYRERVKVSVAPGRADGRVHVRNFPGEQPVLRGQLWIGNPSYWTIRGVDVAWAADNPNEPLVRIFGGTGWRLTRAEIWGARSTSGLQIDDGPRNNLGRWAVSSNCIHDTLPTNGVNQDHNIYVADMSASPRPQGIISRNILFNAENGRGIKLGPGGATGGAVNVAARFNTIYNSSQNVSLSRDTSRVLIERNLLVKASESNITGFMLRGDGNVVRQNVGLAAPTFLDRSGAPGSLVDGGGNLQSRHARFDSIGCSGFHSERYRDYGAHG